MASPPQLDLEVSSDVDLTLNNDNTTSEYGSPDSSMTCSMERHTEQTPVTENTHDDWILVSEEEEKVEETPEKAKESDMSGYVSMLIYESSEESEDERHSEENEAMRHAEARERVKNNLFGKCYNGKPSKHRRRAGYGMQAEKAIKTLFRENISYPLSMFWIWKNTPSRSLISHEAEPSGI